MSTSAYEGPYGASFLAVKRCCDAFERATEIATARNLDRGDIRRAATKSYIKSMPLLVGEDNIRGFIAAVAQGMLLDVFTFKHSTTLVYIAQVALSSYPREVRAAGRPRQNPQPQPAPAAQPQSAPVPPPEPKLDPPPANPGPAPQPQSAPVQPEPQPEPQPATQPQAESIAAAPPESSPEPDSPGAPPAPPEPEANHPEPESIPTIHACVPDTPQQLDHSAVNQKINTPHPSTPVVSQSNLLTPLAKPIPPTQPSPPTPSA
ncbi:MAG TPA: hypothetical protein VMU71_08810, partial [Terracidiphilus sp.]|nr:hypothetical protein [Terracidiphilus sp.]